MTYNDPSSRYQYFHETTWDYLRRAYAMWQEGRRAKAQELLRQCWYFYQKLPVEFAEPELQHNIEKITTIISRGY